MQQEVSGARLKDRARGSAWQEHRALRQECKRTGEETGKEEAGVASQRKVAKLTQTQSAKEKQEQEKGGQGEFKGQFFKCLGWGHSAKFCPNNEKRKRQMMAKSGWQQRRLPSRRKRKRPNRGAKAKE